MNIYKAFDLVSQYLSEAFARLFTPSDDFYPAVGVQPFSGDAFDERSNSNW
ncbi:hypothetical protein IQ249_08070 [Lusitaniella coriacea LEGE 07157]|uniref:Isochorismate synthase n=1 Tax=Lusitaniella coriacea LEGE 07157 TaxID=945747 RepID=A0A8J7DVJ0_9CYAN|nr:hypothetical protein [Lusitaniella coriacea]MBE9115846.1 hypothetical protein [Lusitaniella coriacea LEGE 07157]